MDDLYTSQVHLKRLFAGRATAVFTPAPEQTLKVLDPSLFPGMGILNEDDTGRLQCPVRGCGEFHRFLGRHANMKHRGIGGASAIRSALDIPARIPLASRKTRSAIRVSPHLKDQSQRASERAVEVRRSGTFSRRTTIESRNWADTCPAQLQEKIHALAGKLNRSPSRTDFANEYGHGILSAVVAVFGTWNNAKAICGLSVTAKGNAGCVPHNKLSERLVLESLRAWIDVHGDLPSSEQTRHRDLAPYIPTYAAILSAFQVETWQAAMRSAIAHLGIRSERYDAMQLVV